MGRRHYSAQQALDWIPDLYDSVEEIVANGQTIIYTLHHTIGHLGIFVSGKVAAKEHREFISCMEMIELMPPGLYEATIAEVGEDTKNRELVDGKYLFRIEPRTLNDIRALGINSAEDDKRFATVARVSEINLSLYRTSPNHGFGQSRRSRARRPSARCTPTACASAFSPTRTRS
jgi:hypothetical protein